MLTRGRGREFAAGLLLLLAPGLVAQKQSVKAVIVSPSRPTDSLGETVYEAQGEDQKDVPVVAGVFLPPVATSTPKPKVPKSFKHKKSTEVVIDGVISEGGVFIDGKVSSSTDPEFAALALESVARYTFRPATLDGKRVAALERIVIKFWIF